MSKNWLKIVMLLLMLVSVNEVQAKLFNAEEFFLDNGMQVIVVPNHKAPIIKHMVWYKTGSIDETLGKGGVAHLLEHLMFRGTSKIKGNSLNKLLEENGAESNAFTSLDMTAYHQFLDISRLELAMFLEADRMEYLQLNEEDFQLERDIVYQERKQVVDNNPSAYFNESLRRVLWQEHPYARPITGTEEEILSLQKGDVEAFYNQYYAPNNAILVLAGDIDVATAQKLSQKYYGSVTRKGEIKRKVLPKLEKSFKAQLAMSRPQIKAWRVSKNFAAPSYNQEPDKIYDLTVLSAYLGEGETSKLHKKLVLEQKKALSVSTSYDANARSYGTFSISAIPQQGVRAEELLRAIDVAWNESVAELNAEEVEKVRQKMLAGLVYLRDNPSDAAMIVGSMAVIGMPLAEIESQEDKIRAVDYKNVQKAANELQKNTPQVSAILQPEGEANGTSSAL